MDIGLDLKTGRLTHIFFNVHAILFSGGTAWQSRDEWGE